MLRQSLSDATASFSPSRASPLSTKAYLSGLATCRPTRLLRATKAFSVEGLHLSDRSDKYARVAIIIATALFLYGIAAVSRRKQIKLSALVLGVVVYGTALVALVLA